VKLLNSLNNDWFVVATKEFAQPVNLVKRNPTHRSKQAKYSATELSARQLTAYGAVLKMSILFYCDWYGNSVTGTDTYADQRARNMEGQLKVSWAKRINLSFDTMRLQFV